MTTTATDTTREIIERFDKLYEFDRQPVSRERLEPGRHFAAVFAGEHVAGTEFVIGAVFVSWGVGARDLLLGLLIGNLLAVLSWTLLCAPIAVQTRLTLYWYLRGIAGPVVTAIYNVLNAIMFCILSGTMITVSASAVRIAFGIPPQTQWYPTDPRFVFLVIGVGAVVVCVAILGFRRLAQFSATCVPWIFIMFFAGAVAMLPALAAATPEVGRVESVGDLWYLAKELIWVETQGGFGFWHVAAFAWICNLAMHVGLSDMALLRYAKRPSYGLYSAFGMYLGHFLAWVCAGVMGAAAALILQQPLGGLDAGEVAYQSLGLSGAIAVVLAGWATSNPTLYRAGLALQAVTPGWPRWLVTLIAGVFTTTVACFPFVFTYLLEFVGLYGILLMPIGAVVVVEHWLMPFFGLTPRWFARTRQAVNWPALIAWIVAIAAACYLHFGGIVHLFFLAVPIWFLTATLYVIGCTLAGARRPPGAPVPVETSRRAGPAHETAPQPASPRWPERSAREKGLLALTGCVALASLAGCFVVPMWVGFGSAEGYGERLADYKFYLAALSIAHLAGAAAWVFTVERRREVAHWS